MLSKVELCEAIGQHALTSLLYEVSATPKPGLVDRANQGAHKDMDFYSFMASSAALHLYFIKCAFYGAEFEEDKLSELLTRLRPAGVEAEKAMFKATGGVNTHKGLIFSLGIICAASAYCMEKEEEQRPNIGRICEIVSSMSQGVCSRELVAMEKTGRLTHGEKLFKKYGFKGIRGEVESGFPTVRNYSFPIFTKLKSMKTYSYNDILVQTLLHLMAVNEDTNIAARHDKDMLSYVQKYAAEVLEAGGICTESGYQRVKEMDKEFIKRNISPGGSADLLAITIMFDLLSDLLTLNKFSTEVLILN